ncbi:Guanine nucleotide-binding protein-like 3-like protein [Diplonema papillatum]|nr:Guanine nucleotide-binding protein-like 3-like protein [Diplonema papillatum]
MNGVVMSESTDAETVLRNALKIEQIADPVRPVELIVERCGLERLQLIYSLPACRDFDDFVGQIARKKGKLLRGAQPNVDEACKAVLKDWNDGRIHFYTSPPGDRDFITDDARQTCAFSSRALGSDTLKHGKPGKRVTENPD